MNCICHAHLEDTKYELRHQQRTEQSNRFQFFGHLVPLATGL